YMVEDDTGRLWVVIRARCSLGIAIVFADLCTPVFICEQPPTSRSSDRSPTLGSNGVRAAWASRGPAVRDDKHRPSASRGWSTQSLAESPLSRGVCPPPRLPRSAAAGGRRPERRRAARSFGEPGDGRAGAARLTGPFRS